MKTIQCKAYDELVTLENCEPVPDLAACRTCKSPKNTLQSKKSDMKKLSKGQPSKEAPNMAGREKGSALDFGQVIKSLKWHYA